MLAKKIAFVFITFFLFSLNSIQANTYTVIKCYVCEDRLHYDCVSKEYIQQCPASYDGCQARIIIMDNGRKRFQRHCAVMATCGALRDDWLNNGFCHGNEGSMCVDCCHGSLCNGYDPAERLLGRAGSLQQFTQKTALLVLLSFSSWRHNNIRYL